MLWIYGMPTRFDGDSAARSPQKLATCHFRLSRLGVAPVHDRDVDVHIGRISVFLTSKALVTSFLTISFCVISLSSFERINAKIQFLTKPNQTSTSLPTCEKWVHSKNWFLWKKFIKYFPFDSGCTVHYKVTYWQSLKVGYIANFGQKSFFRVYHYNLVPQKENLSKNICWKFEGNWTTWKRVM